MSTLDRGAVDAALRKVIAFLDYDLHKALEHDEETEQDAYGEHVDRFAAAYDDALPYLAPAGDGGLREALEKALESPADLWHENSFRVKALPETVLRELLALHPAAPAVPQPVDREAVAAAAHKYYCVMPGEPTHEPDEIDYDKADEILEILALLAGEQEQVESQQ